MKIIIILSIKLYQKIISPFIGPACRFLPSCSDYTYQAVQKYGAVKGSFMGMKRIMKCHPFYPGGFDPVP